MHSTSYSEYLAPACEIAREAGRLIMRHFSGPVTARAKHDDSPVTDADIEANALITAALARLTPHIPVVAEEDEALADAAHEIFWLVDPLDGTRSFVRGEPEFTVNLGLVSGGVPLLGVIYAPPQEQLYYGEVFSSSPIGGGPGWGRGTTGGASHHAPLPASPLLGEEKGRAFRATGTGSPEPIRARPAPPEGLTVVRSKSHPSAKTAAFLETLHIREILPGSSSVKFCRVAEGSADIYPRFGRTMEWDTAAGHAILSAAGGRVETADGQPLCYGKPGFENPAFIAYGK